MEPGEAAPSQVTEMMKRLENQQRKMNQVRAYLESNNGQLDKYISEHLIALNSNILTHQDKIRQIENAPSHYSSPLLPKHKRILAKLTQNKNAFKRMNREQIRAELQRKRDSIQHIGQHSSSGGRRKSRSCKRTLRKHKRTLRKHKRRTHRR
jgi:hypothetical protein